MKFFFYMVVKLLMLLNLSFDTSAGLHVGQSVDSIDIKQTYSSYVVRLFNQSEDMSAVWD